MPSTMKKYSNPCLPPLQILPGYRLVWMVNSKLNSWLRWLTEQKKVYICWVRERIGKRERVCLTSIVVRHLLWSEKTWFWSLITDLFLWFTLNGHWKNIALNSLLHNSRVPPPPHLLPTSKTHHLSVVGR